MRIIELIVTATAARTTIDAANGPAITVNASSVVVASRTDASPAAVAVAAVAATSTPTIVPTGRTLLKASQVLRAAVETLPAWASTLDVSTTATAAIV